MYGLASFCLLIEDAQLLSENVVLEVGQVMRTFVHGKSGKMRANRGKI
jgi:hypothetical protein